MTPRPADAADRYRRYLETLTPQSLDALGDHVTADVRFKDPFNDVRGLNAMRRVFEHMFENVSDIRFTVHGMALDGATCFMNWQFAGRLGKREWVFDGASVITLGTDGKVVSHIDHWDAAAAFYERLPVIGWLLARIRGRLAIR
jgi:predicted ester cyclase